MSLSAFPSTILLLIDSHSREHIPVGGKITDITHTPTNGNEGAWSEELAMSALHHVGEQLKLREALRVGGNPNV